jgi:hypothetical protein
MTQQASNYQPPSNGKATSAPAFKPVALPALAAAVRVAQRRPSSKKKSELPAILRQGHGHD